MLYQPFQEVKLSVLGMGNMRLPTQGQGGPIDEEKAREIIEYAYRHGVNYFDTAYRYHGGASESFVGRVLSQFPRAVSYTHLDVYKRQVMMLMWASEFSMQ